MLRHSPRLTPASLAARRANALKSTGPRSEQGKARAALNPLQHGRCAVNLPDRLVRAGYPSEAAEWHAIRARVARTFQPTSPASSGRDDTNPSGPDKGNPHPKFEKSPSGIEKKMDRLANWVWCWRREWQQQEGAKLESPLESCATAARLSHPSQIRIYDPWSRRGLVFYAQRRRGWVWRQLQTRVLGRRVPGPGEHRENTTRSGDATEGAERSGCATGVPRLERDRQPKPPREMRPRIESEMEGGLRSRAYRMGRPRFWEQIRYCLDREGVYHPEWRVRYSQLRQELRGSPMAVWLEPHPILAGIRLEAQRQAGSVAGPSGGGA